MLDLGRSVDGAAGLHEQIRQDPDLVVGMLLHRPGEHVEL
jgi:hypothetical protein